MIKMYAESMQTVSVAKSSTIYTKEEREEAMRVIENNLNCDILDIRKLAHLKRVEDVFAMEEGKRYLAVPMRGGLPYVNYKQPFVHMFTATGGKSKTDAVIVCKRTIMDGNLEIRDYYEVRDTAVYYCPEEEYLFA